MLQPAHCTRAIHGPRSRARTLALPPSLRRRPRVRCSYAVLRTTLRTLLALPPESARDAERAVALIMRRVRTAD
jgi:hypothetical protein